MDASPVSPAITDAPPRGTRHASLDIARGLAILGTLAMNIWIFSHPTGFLGYLDSPTSDIPGWQHTVAQVLQQLTNGKFLGLLTLMFGIGLALQAESAQRRGRPWPGTYGWRAAILFLEGLLHYLLVTEFDVLMGYAVSGAIVAWVIGCSARVRRAWFGVAVTLHVALVSLLTLASLWVGEPDATATPTPAAQLYRDGSWWDLVLLRLDNGLLFRFEPVFMLAMNVALFLVGAWLYRAGILDQRGRRLRAHLLALGSVAFVADLGLGLASPAWFFVTRYGTAPLVALGLLALVVTVVSDGRSWAGRRLGEIGRVALSAYVLQNLVASVLFYGWGLDLGAMPGTWRLPVTVLAWAGISAILMVGAHVWLQRFNRGPLEAIAHALHARLAGA